MVFWDRYGAKHHQGSRARRAGSARGALGRRSRSRSGGQSLGAGRNHSRLGRDIEPDRAADPGATQAAVAPRVLVEVLLVVVLGVIERAGLGDLGGYVRVALLAQPLVEHRP